MKHGVEELYANFAEEFGGPNVFSRKATREKYLREAINLGYRAREQEIADLEKTVSLQKEKIASLMTASKSASGSAFSIREYQLEQEVNYQKSRVAALLDAMAKTIQDYEKANIRKK